MRRNRRRLLFAAFGVATIEIGIPVHHNATGEAATRGGPRTPVVVELFTSEGCSSCPPADAALAWLDSAQPVPGAEVIALAQHVDYWNSGSWTDPYSSAAYSARQRSYGAKFRLDSVYTPQMVVDGRTEFVGSDRDRATAAIGQAAKALKAEVHINLTSGNQGDAVEISVRRAPIPTGDAANVMLAVTEDNLHSDVTGGENGGRRLSHTAVVRSLRRIGTVRANDDFKATTPLAASAAWNRRRMRAVVFVEDRDGIVGAASAPVTEGQPAR